LNVYEDRGHVLILLSLNNKKPKAKAPSGSELNIAAILQRLVVIWRGAGQGGPSWNWSRGPCANLLCLTGPAGPCNSHSYSWLRL